ncbi:MAG: leucine--tRNA ligase, partial [Deinococcales bacterium]
FGQMGAMFDWSKKVVTCDPEYYRWNQWFFIRMFERGLAYRKESFVNWDPVDQTVLANEQVVNGRGERSGALIERRLMPQWHFKITDYADELLDFSGLDWPERVKVMQTNWIGRSEGAEVTFHSEPGDPITVFTTRPDTLWGATFMVLAPEHPLVDELTTPERRAEVEAYVDRASRMSELDRQAEGKEKTGAFIGAYAVNPVNDARIPIWIADYVLMGYGTGAIMGVPAHDERDFDFARRFGLDVVPVIQPEGAPLDGAAMTEAYTGDGVMANSGPFDGTPSGKEGNAEGIRAVTHWLEERGIGTGKVTYRLRDWLISRQRYWGTPIPMLYCERCGIQPEKDENLPVVLPDDVAFMPTGESPLKTHAAFLEATCPSCGGPATRETDTMDPFMDSSWYWFRYLSPHRDDAPFDRALVERWTPVDTYTGGIEHAILHLLYARFFTKVLRDLELVDIDEPFLRLRNQGMILGEDNEKMSKSRGNVVNPVTEDFEAFQFNTAVAELMTLQNAMAKAKNRALTQTDAWREAQRTLLLLLAPIAPHLAEELWERIGQGGSVHLQPWPEYDPDALVQDTITMAVQVNGKVRGQIQVPPDADKDAVLESARSEPNVARYLDAGTVQREIVVPGKLVSFVVR